MKAFNAAIMFIFTVALGMTVAIRSWKGMVYWYPEKSRNPAAIKKVFDFSHLEGRALEMASYKRLVVDALVTDDTDSLGVELGHFVVKGLNDQRQFACDVYNKVELVFESADMSVSGEPSKMKVEADCNVHKDINRIDTVWIPMRKILQEKEGDKELQFTEKGGVHLTFYNIGDRWPRAWTLSNVKLYNDDDFSKMLQIDRSQMREILNKPLTLLWDKDL
ncbi:MAG: hypothetical protein KDD40_02720 [Bdellovibrionales bacterium]|nr:hypothetical protein [Bdellovibrionales bacterium]